jgi:hypothetical protein
MAIEQSPLLIEEQTPVDGELYALYHAVPAADTSESDRLIPAPSQVAAQKKEFYDSNCLAAPDLRPASLSVHELDEYEQHMLRLKDQLADRDEDPELLQAYRWRINEKVGKTRILRASVQGNMNEFGHYNYFAYGSPRQDIFAATVDSFVSHAEMSQQHPSSNVRAAAEAVIGLLAEHRGDKAILAPAAEVFNTTRDAYYKPGGYYALLLAGVEMPSESPINKESGDPVVEQLLHNLGAPHRIVDAAGATWSVNSKRQEIRRPGGYNLPIERFLGLPVGHELGHLLEGMNGKRSAIRLTGSGLDRFEVGSEGRGLVPEQVAYDTFEKFTDTDRWQTVLRRHFATAITLGAMGTELAFPETYRYVNAVDRLYQTVKSPDDPEGAAARAHEKTWALMNQTHKGTDGTTGAVYRRYMMYLEGNKAVWEAEAAHQGRVLEGSRGKFDISNSRHIALLQKYHVLPSSPA